MDRLARAACAAALLVLAAAAQPEPAGWVDRSETITVDGRERRYELTISPGGRGPRPLVLWLHGGNGDGPLQKRRMESGGRDLLAGFVSVYPSGLGGWNDGRSAFISDRAQAVDDVAFLTALIDRLVDQGIADKERVFVIGGSNGGVMAQKLACERAGRLAGIAIVGAGMDARAAASCRPARPVPVVHLHGTEDRLMPFAGGRVVPMARRDSGEVLPAFETARFWASRNGCTGAPRQQVLPARPDQPGMGARLFDWSCGDRSRVRFYQLDGHGHGWPGLGGQRRNQLAGPMSNVVDARVEILRFFGLR